MARAVVATGMLGGWLTCCSIVAAVETVYPSKDGTLVDGGAYGPFDGVADNADWDFKNANYQGVITLSTEPGWPSFEHRAVWKYDLSGVTADPPTTATLTFTIRGPQVYPFPDVALNVYAYPADLLETLDDFHTGPAVLQGAVAISPNQPPTEYSLDVSAAVSEALLNGGDKVAFRFQIAPDTPNNANQAFIDALDSDPSTKPYLTVGQPTGPGDLDGDGDVDLDDYDIFSDCVTGPSDPVVPGCEAADLDDDGHVALLDFGIFQSLFAGTGG